MGEAHLDCVALDRQKYMSLILSIRSGLAICVALLALAAGPAAGQEIRPTLDKIKETVQKIAPRSLRRWRPSSRATTCVSRSSATNADKPSGPCDR